MDANRLTLAGVPGREPSSRLDVITVTVETDETTCLWDDQEAQHGQGSWNS